MEDASLFIDDQRGYMCAFVPRVMTGSAVFHRWVSSFLQVLVCTGVPVFAEGLSQYCHMI
jgi:hypothetical protein